MPQFKTTKDILKSPWEDELYNENWIDSNTLITPPKKNWDYSRELKIEDIDIWEVLYYEGGGLGLYAAWEPYAEFYLITQRYFSIRNNAIETYYGKGAQQAVQKRCKDLGIPVMTNQYWVEDKDMWLYN
jgi:hypothetical protein